MKISLCGSLRFEESFHTWNEVLSLSGHIVYGCAVYPSRYKGLKEWYTPNEKATLDMVHLGKIANSDAIFVLNEFGYIGESTLREIRFAEMNGKGIYCLESWGKGNGIGAHHTTSVRAAAGSHGVLGTSSPIDTSCYSNKWQLLNGVDEDTRKHLMRTIKSHEEKMGRGS